MQKDEVYRAVSKNSDGVTACYRSRRIYIGRFEDLGMRVVR